MIFVILLMPFCDHVDDIFNAFFWWLYDVIFWWLMGHFWCHVWWHFNHFCVMFDHLWYDVLNDILTLWCDGMMVWCYDSDILWWHCAEIAKYVFIQGFIAYFVWMMFCWLIYIWTFLSGGDVMMLLFLVILLMPFWWHFVIIPLHFMVFCCSCLFDVFLHLFL